MKTEKVIDGKRCRLYSFGLALGPGHPKKIWLADTGDFAAYYDAGGKHHGSLNILCNDSGPYFEDIGERFHIDGLVMALFGPDRIWGYTNWTINHKDGNLMNCDYRNLEWVRQNAPFDSQM